MAPPLTEIREGCWVRPICAGKGTTSEAIETKPLKRLSQQSVPHNFLQSLQGSEVMSEAKGRQTRSSKRLGVASYSGRQGRTHSISIAFEHSSSELLTAAQLKSRVAVDSTRPPVARNGTSAPSARNHVSMTNSPSLAEVNAYSDHIMPDEHDRQKYESVVPARKDNKVHNCIITVAEDLCHAVCMNIESTFLPCGGTWTALNILRSYGCTLRTSPH